MKLRFALAAVLLAAATLVAADKPKITSQDQLPRFSYPLTGKVTDIVTNDTAYDGLAAAVRADLEKLLNDYDIADRATLQGLAAKLLAINPTLTVTQVIELIQRGADGRINLMNPKKSLELLTKKTT